MYLYFASFLNTETSQVVKIHSEGKQEYPHNTELISWLLLMLFMQRARASAALIGVDLVNPEYSRQ